MDSAVPSFATTMRRPLKRDFEAIFAIDKFPSRFHGQLSSFVQDTLCAHRGIDCSFLFPNVRVLFRHARLVEAGMKDTHWNTFGFQLLCQKNRHHILSSFAHLKIATAEQDEIGEEYELDK